MRESRVMICRHRWTRVARSPLRHAPMYPGMSHAYASFQTSRCGSVIASASVTSS